VVPQTTEVGSGSWSISPMIHQLLEKQHNTVYFLSLWSPYDWSSVLWLVKRFECVCEMPRPLP